MFWSKKPKVPKKPKAKTAKSAAPKTPKPYKPPPAPPKPFAEKSKSTPSSSKPKHSVDYEKEFLKTFKTLNDQHRAWDVWQDFIVMSACSISNVFDKEHYEEREKRYLQITDKYGEQIISAFAKMLAYLTMALEQNPEQDFLGKIYIDLGLQDNGRMQHFTPYSICELMADITLDNIVSQVQEKGFITINDPCCGAGATLIAGIHSARKKLEKENLNFQNHILIAAQDIDEIVALMCYIQLSLLGVVAYIKVGNTLTDPMASDDTTENCWFTPMYFSYTWHVRRLIQHMNRVLGGENE